MDGQNTNTNTNTEETQIEAKAIRLNESMWGSYKYLAPIAKPGDYIIPLRLSNAGNDTWILTFKLIRVREAEVSISE
jgi:hypothetical protein